MAVISIVAIIIFWQVHDLLVSVVKLGGKGFQIQEMGTDLILRKIISAKLVWSVSFLHKIAVKHQVERWVRTIRSFKNISSFQNIRNLGDYWIEVKLISATLLRIRQGRTSFYVEYKFHEIFREN